MFSNDDDKRDMNKIVLSLIINSIGFIQSINQPFYKR